MKVTVMAALRTVPTGRVTTFDAIAVHAGASAHFIMCLIDGLSDDERQLAPWHRVVAKGGAIGRGPHREAQFARLVREGVPVSPAGIVQDMPRHLVATFDEARRLPASVKPAPLVTDQAPASRSRGMKDRPR